MTDLISRQAAIKAIDDLPNCYNGYSDTYDKAYIIGVLEELPTIDHVKHTCKYWDSESSFCTLNKPSDVKHGKWISVFIEYTDGSTGQRSECPFCKEQQLIWSNYCPNCGARLDL